MCFFKDHSEHKITDRNIVCYKTVLVNTEDDNPKEGLSIYAGFRYKVGETYIENSLTLDELNEKQRLYHGVFHSFTRISNEYLKELAVDNEYWFRRGIKRTICIMECVIPAGTPYWENLGYQEYASTSIKVLRIVNPIKVLNTEDGE